MSFSKKLDDGIYLGEVPGIPPGTFFLNRQELYDNGLHRDLIREIAPHGSSVVISGGHPDDVDESGVIIFTGEGGRDPKTNIQKEDQEFVGGYKHLAENHLRGIPVRVHRSVKVHLDKTNDAKVPIGFRYRYEGLYRVAECWEEKSGDGFNICRFRLEKNLEMIYPMDETNSLMPVPPAGSILPQRKESRIVKVVRDTDVSDYVKNLYDFTCQICNIRLTTTRGAYAEGCHIRPIGRPHNGPDEVDNMLCLCPNCHVLFDEHAIWIDDNFKIMGAVTGELSVKSNHGIKVSHLTYHRSTGRH